MKRALTGFVAVLRREIAERRLLIVAAVLLGLVPLAVPLLPMGSVRGPEARAGTAAALALIASFVLAVVLGSSVLARDLAERRLGFYFSRPLPGWSIWAGKLTAAALLAFGSGLLILLPSLLLGDGLDPSGYWGQGAFWETASGMDGAFWAASVLVLLLGANVLGVMVRSRSPWLLLDLLAAVGLAALLWLVSLRLALAGATGPLGRAGLGLLAAILLSLAAASAVQVTRARTDLRRGHQVLSFTLWGLLGLSTAVFGGYARWVLAATPRDLVRIENLLPAPAGEWVVVQGVARDRAGFKPWFLLDTASGRSLRIPSMPGFWGWPVFSQDGRRALWLESESRRYFPLSVHRLDLDRPGATPSAERIGFDSEIPYGLALSPDGARLASIYKNRIQVHELGSGRLLMSQAPPAGEVWGGDRLRFLDGRTLRFVGSRRTGPPLEGDIVVVDLDVESGRSRESQVLGEDQLVWGFSADGQRLLLRSRRLDQGRFELRVADLRTGEVSAPLSMPGPLGEAGFLRDGRLVTASARSARVSLQILDGRRAEMKRLDLPGSRVRLGGQPMPGLLVVATAEGPANQDRSHWRTFLLDLDRGTLLPFGEGLSPVGWPGLRVGSLGTQLFLQGRNGLVRIDPATGRRRVILP